MDFDDYYVGKIPIPKKLIKIPKFVQLANQIIELNKRLDSVSKFSDKENQLQNEIRKTDKKIDEIVYNLYNLTKREIAIIKDSYSA